MRAFITRAIIRRLWRAALFFRPAQWIALSAAATPESLTMPDTVRRPSPTLNHPLMGADLRTLGAVLFGNGALPPAAWPLTAALLASALARSPFTLAEGVYAKARRRRLPPSPPPVFILGHWRSGTTHLFNLMSRDPRFAWVDPIASGMPNDFLLLGRLLRPVLARALPEDRYIDNIPVHLDSPQEDEIGLASMQEVSYYHAMYFPERFESHFMAGLFHEGLDPARIARWREKVRDYAERLLITRPGATLLIKNPVYTGLVAQMRAIWPEARFVHIYRNPYVVFQSTRAFYRRLLPRFALQPYREDMADALILKAYPRMLERLEADTKDLPEDRFLTLRFEDLEAAPIETLGQIYDRLGLEGFAEVRPTFEAYVGGISGYRKNRYGFSEDLLDAVDRHWGGYVDRWGYTRPS